jgi:hypothetical protein
MSSSVTLIDGGRIVENPRAFIDAELPTKADVLYALERQKTRILDRTARGVDFENRPFAPYSTKGPYYYTPSTAGKGDHADNTRRIRSRDRFAKKLGLVKPVTKGFAIRFDSYAAFKASLGRAGVDLTGVSAPHMLQAIVAKVQEDGRGAFAGTLGIYGDEALRASGHNVGNPNRGLPQRRFFDSSRQDIEDFYADLDDRRAARSR